MVSEYLKDKYKNKSKKLIRSELIEGITLAELTKDQLIFLLTIVNSKLAKNGKREPPKNRVVVIGEAVPESHWLYPYIEYACFLEGNLLIIEGQGYKIDAEQYIKLRYLKQVSLKEFEKTEFKANLSSQYAKSCNSCYTNDFNGYFEGMKAILNML